MSYDKNTWAKGDVITAAKLNNMEDGIANAGGGGVLVANVTAIDEFTYDLDKTWQEIHDAQVAFVVYDDGEGYLYCNRVKKVYNDGGYFVECDELPYTSQSSEFEANSANSYPSLSEK